MTRLLPLRRLLLPRATPRRAAPSSPPAQRRARSAARTAILSPGPDGAPLFVDEARLGPPDARRVLFLASGTHGIEGFCGSGIQTFLLRDGVAGRLPEGVGPRAACTR